ncbi:MAG: thioesterase [Desulfurococcales archaeon]|nr:thioesterase [Desulfurococcales archaeon]
MIGCTERFRVEDGHVAEHLAERGLEVLSTPCLILFIERTARRCMERVIPEGYTSVGVRIDVRHRKPVPLGGVVEVHVKAHNDGDYYFFNARVTYNGELVADGIHVRKAVRVEDLRPRLS